MARTLLQQNQAAVNALKAELMKIDATKHPDKFSRKAAALRRLEKVAKPKPEPTVSKSTLLYQQEQILKQLASGVSKEERDKLVDQFGELAGMDKMERGDPDAEHLLNTIVVAMEAGERAKKRALL